MWLYIAWAIILAGAELTAAAQGTEFGFSLDYRTPTFARAAALLTIFRAAERAIRRNMQACTVDGLAGELCTVPDALRPIVERLEIAGLVLEISPEVSARHSGIFLLRDSSELTLAEVLEAIDSPPENINGDECVGAVLRSLAASERDAFRAITVKDLLEGRFAQCSSVEQRGLP
ncbi:MAG: hypothetical protein JO166_05630 [Deltaproteobacteria bacterium]|nr:hypothetical protein [Deltaproteobacteria bacterium]